MSPSPTKVDNKRSSIPQPITPIAIVNNDPRSSKISPPSPNRTASPRSIATASSPSTTIAFNSLLHPTSPRSSNGSVPSPPAISSASKADEERQRQQLQPTNRSQPYPTSLLVSGSAPEVREYLFKLLVIGELGTGKTSFIKRYVHQYFSQHYRATIGVDFAMKSLNWDENTLIRLQLWDIAGQERFGNMTRVYYKEAVGAFLVFDVSTPSTFNAVVKWKHDLDTKVCLADGDPIPCLLLANKCDDKREGIAADEQALDTFVKENNFVGWYYTSAKEDLNVEESAKFLVGNILQRQKLYLSDDKVDADVINLDYSSHSRSKVNKKCSC